jgi:hypothetical protein
VQHQPARRGIRPGRVDNGRQAKRPGAPKETGIARQTMIV